MKRTLNALLNDENGFVVSAELVLVLTVGVLAMVVGLHAVSKSITMEMNDIANAFGALDQSYSPRIATPTWSVPASTIMQTIAIARSSRRTNRKSNTTTVVQCTKPTEFE